MAYDIGPRIGIQGEKEFNNQIREINNSIKEYGSEMNLLTQKFDKNAKSQDALTAKTRVLEKEYDAQKRKSELLRTQYDKEVKKLKDLADAVQKAKDENGESSAEAAKAENAFNKQAEAVSKLKVAVNETEGYLVRLEREISDNETALREMENGTRDAVTGLADLSDGADEAKKSLKEAGAGMEELEKKMDAGLLMQTADTFSSIADSAMDAAENSKEFIKIYGQLEASSKNLGYTNEQTNETFKQLYGILGDDQTAATTTANLQALRLEQDQLRQMTEGVIGTWAQYGDSIPIDGLAEAINETVKTGQVTGTLADALNWAGTSEDDFNLKLAECRDESERANLILQEFADQGLLKSADGFRQNNKELVESNEAQLEYQKTMAELGKTVLPLMTQITDGVTAVINAFNSLPEPARQVIAVITGILAVGSKVAPLFTAIQGLGAAGKVASLGSKISGLIPIIGGALSAAAPVVGTIAGIAAAIGGVILVIQNWGDIVDWLKEHVGPILEDVKGFFAGVGEKITDIKDGAVETVKGWAQATGEKFEEMRSGAAEKVEAIKSAVSEKLSSAKQKAGELFSGIAESAREKLQAAKEWAREKIDSIKGFFSNLSLKLPEIKIPKIKLPHFSIKGEFSIAPPSIPTLSVDWYKEGGILSGAQIFGRMGSTFLGGGESGREAVLPLAAFYEELKGILREALSRDSADYMSGGAITLHAVTNVYIGNKAFKSFVAETALDGISQHVKEIDKSKGR